MILALCLIGALAIVLIGGDLAAEQTVVTHHHTLAGVIVAAGGLIFADVLILAVAVFVASIFVK